MNPHALYELAQIAEQEHMHQAERRAALRAARRQAGLTWTARVMALVRLRSSPVSTSPAPRPASRPAPLRVAGAAPSADCVTADC